MELENPTPRLLRAIKAAGGELGPSTWHQTCHNPQCGCMSHDSGYEIVVATLGTLDAREVVYYGGDASSFGWHDLREE